MGIPLKIIINLGQPHDYGKHRDGPNSSSPRLVAVQEDLAAAEQEMAMDGQFTTQFFTETLRDSLHVLGKPHYPLVVCYMENMEYMEYNYMEYMDIPSGKLT
jgi:hypothetical protein